MCPYTLTQGQSSRGIMSPRGTPAAQAVALVKSLRQPWESLWKHTCISSLSTNVLKRSDSFQNWESQASPFVPFYWHFWPWWKSVLCFAIKMIGECSLLSDISYYRTEHSKPLSSKERYRHWKSLGSWWDAFFPWIQVHSVNLGLSVSKQFSRWNHRATFLWLSHSRKFRSSFK